MTPADKSLVARLRYQATQTEQKLSADALIEAAHVLAWANIARNAALLSLLAGDWVLVPRDDPARPFADSLLPDEDHPETYAAMVRMAGRENDALLRAENAEASLALAVRVLEPFARLAAPMHDEPGSKSRIDLITLDGEYDELALRSHVEATRYGEILDADDFRAARLALIQIKAEGD